MLSESWQRSSAIRIARFPAGKIFAITFVDDTDLSTRANTEPVYDFLWQHGLLGTKTVWTSRRKRTSAYRKDLERAIDGPDDSGATLEDPDYLDFILKLARLGYEIALHDVAGGNSYREEIIEGLERFRTVFGAYPRINIFHERNIENLYAGRHKLDLWPLRMVEGLLQKSNYLGHVPGSPYFWGDLAKEKITYMRVPFHTLRTVNTLSVNPSMPFRDLKRPFVNYWFANSDGSDVRRFNALLSSENLRRLEQEQGACVVYTHFAKGFAVRRGGRYELDAEFMTIVKTISGRTNVWCPTASALLDRLASIRQISVEQRDREVIIRNHSTAIVDEVALHVPHGLELQNGGGCQLQSCAPGAVKIGGLRGHETVRLRSNVRLPFARAGQRTDAIGRRERAMLEIMNYVGMLRD